MSETRDRGEAADSGDEPCCPRAADGGPAAGTDWEERYRTGETGWDLGLAPPPLMRLLRTMEGGPSRRVLVPGAGRGHDARAWAAAGHDTVAFDAAPTAVAEARRLAAEKLPAEARARLEIVQADLFDLPDAWHGRFDAAWEQTCFCAIHPDERPGYAGVLASMLKPGGVLHALLWNCGRVEDGPPWDVTPGDVRTIFGAHFTVESLEDCPDSVESRAGEFLCRLRRREA